jgi:hypothetical protein
VGFERGANNFRRKHVQCYETFRRVADLDDKSNGNGTHGEARIGLMWLRIGTGDWCL